MILNESELDRLRRHLPMDGLMTLATLKKQRADEAQKHVDALRAEQEQLEAAATRMGLEVGR